MAVGMIQRGSALTPRAFGGPGRRFGRPRTNAERRKRHKARFGTSKLPPRGTGLKRAFAMVKARRRGQ